MFLELKNIHFQLPCVLETIQDNRIRTTLLVQYFQLKKKNVKCSKISETTKNRHKVVLNKSYKNIQGIRFILYLLY